MLRIVRFHGLDPLPAHCYRCGVRPSNGEWGRLYRAHVIDRSRGGLDLEPNLIPLCGLCHKVQPSFVPGQEDEAWAWMQGDPDAWLQHLLEKHGGPTP